MGFYGNITNTSKTQFQFDRTYPNRFTMESTMTVDNIYAGRYVLIEYDSDLQRSLDVFQRVYMHNGIAYSSKKPSAATMITQADIGLGDIVYTAADYIEDQALVPKDCVFWKCTSNLVTGSRTAATFEKAVSSESNYVMNFNIDTARYGEGRGYDSTVWQKAYINGNEKYIQIAELNSVVPTFDISADAPTVYPIQPHFDTQSTNVYYKLHWQPQWGFRALEADRDKTTSQEGHTYPSDESVNYMIYEYDATTGKLNSDRIDYPAAIYYNKAGFDKATKTYHTQYTDEIQVAPTGISGNAYNTHGAAANTNTTQPDIQEFKILLPSLGNTVSDVWDMIYGCGKKVEVDETVTGSDTNAIRFRDIEWKDAVTGSEDTTIGGMTRDLNTLAGCINKVHDLMGMIITDKANATLNEEWYTKNYIYEDNGAYYRIHKFPTYTTSIVGELNLPIRSSYYSDQEYNAAYELAIKNTLQDNEYYLIKDTNSVNYKVATLNEKALVTLADSDVIGYQSGYGYEYVLIPEMPGKMATIYGLILQMKNLLEVEDSETRDLATVTGSINQLNDIIRVFEDLVPGEFLICDASGHVNSANWTTAQDFTYQNHNALNPASTEKTFNTKENRWISLSMDEVNREIELTHIFNPIDNTTTTSDKNNASIGNGINKSTDDTLKLYTPIVDAMGHVVGKNTETVTLPYSFKTITPATQSTAVTNPDVNTNTITADNTQDGLTIATTNKWIRTSASNTNDTFSIGHEVHEFESGKANTKYGLEADTTVSDLNADNTFEVPVFKFDEAGHVTMAETHTVTIPENFDKVAITVTGKDSAAVNASSAAATLEADTLTDTVTFDVGNRWIQLVGNASTDKVSIHHAAPGAQTNTTKTGNETPNYGVAFNIPEVKYDEAGHISGVATHTVTFPTPSLNDLTASTASVVTGIQMVDGTLAITQTNANVGTRALTDYTIGTNNTDIVATDSINTAFGKLQVQMHDEETNRANAITNLDTKLSTAINNLDQELNQKITDLDTELSNEISTVNTNLTNAINEQNTRLSKNIGDLDTKLTKAVEDEATTRANAVIDLQNKITAEETARVEAINALDYSSPAVANEYISEVTQTDGKITVTRVALPDYSNYWTKISTLEETVKTQGETIATLQSTITELITRIETLEAYHAPEEEIPEEETPVTGE